MAGLLIYGEDRQGQPHLIVVEELRGDRRTVGGHDLRQQVLGRGLANGSGDRDDINVSAGAQVLEVGRR